MEGFRALIELHVILSAEREKTRQQQAVEAELAALDGRLAAARQSLADAEARVRRLQADKKAAELEVSAIEQTRKKYREQLMGAKTNEVYRALLNEIETAGRSLSEKETIVLGHMEGLDVANAEVKAAHEALAAAQAALDAEAVTLRQRAAEIQASRDADQAVIKSLEPSIPRDLLTRFRRIADARHGRGLALAANASCTECHVAVRPQVWVELAARPGAHQCAGCGRLLYREESLREKQAAAAPPTPGEVTAGAGTP